MPESTACLLLAAGTGSRAGFDQRKQFIRIAGKTLLEHSLEALRHSLPETLIVVVAPHDALDKVRELIGHDPRTLVVAGGPSRQASTLRGLQALKQYRPKNVLIHDAARPFVDARILEDVMVALRDHEAVDVAIPTADTIIQEREGFIEHIPKRTHLLRGQTPQAFRYDALYACYETLGEYRLDQYTDDCGIFLACNPEARIRIVKGSEENIKVTHPIDLILADEMFRLRASGSGLTPPGINMRDQRALIFGGTRGIGKAIADIMRSSGARVVTRSRENGCDITQESDIEQALASAAVELGGLDIVVNAAGLLHSGELAEQSSAEIASQIAINFTGAVNLARLAYPWLKQTRGSLLFFASSSYTRGRAGYVTYSATKAAIVNLTQGLSEEWSADGIRVNCVVPGRTDTDMRRSNFQEEDPASLLNAYEVGLTATRILSSTSTSQIARCH